MNQAFVYTNQLSPTGESSDTAQGEAAIIVTGAAGFIGSCMVQHLNDHGFENLILVDDFGREDKRKNWETKKYRLIIERYNLFDWLSANRPNIRMVIHLGARTDTTEFDYAIHEMLNVQYSKDVWSYCTKEQIPLIYASSAATYGSGDLGYADDHDLVEKLIPLNPYGVSKNEFDKWAISELAANRPSPPCWAGLKFFNVYGPNEYHKGRMASVIWHAFNQIKKEGVVKLFKSHKAGFADGEQLRDFVYIKDVLGVIAWMQSEMLAGNWTVALNGLYNLGTGKARAFKDLVAATFAGMDTTLSIRYIDMPEDIRDKYQYFTEADMRKLRKAGYQQPFYSLEEGVADYVRNYLLSRQYF